MTKTAHQPRPVLHEAEAHALLKEYRIPVARTVLAKSGAEASQLFSELGGGPVVLKISSPDILHKTDVGGVRTMVRTADDAADAYEGIMSSVKRLAPKAEIEGITVQPHVERGVEVIVGGLRDPQFGPVVMFGLGGVWIELFKDVSYRLAPTTLEKAKRMMMEIRASPVLKRFRGGEPVDIDTLARIIVSVSELMADREDIMEIDVNPIFARRDGAIAVDVKVIGRSVE
jgi:acetyl-CoA synthetase (ADP-forming)